MFESQLCIESTEFLSNLLALYTKCQTISHQHSSGPIAPLLRSSASFTRRVIHCSQSRSSFGSTAKRSFCNTKCASMQLNVRMFCREQGAARRYPRLSESPRSSKIHSCFMTFHEAEAGEADLCWKTILVIAVMTSTKCLPMCSRTGRLSELAVS